MPFKKFIPNSQFGKQVLTLLTGTGIAQGIQILSTPLLSRIYSPAEFGVFALFFSMTSLLAIPSSGKYDRAILLPKEESDALVLSITSIAISLCYCSVAFVIVVVFQSKLASLFTTKMNVSLLVLVPVTVFFLSVYQIVNTWLNRRAEYKRLATNRVVRVVITLVLTIVLGITTMKPIGLVLGFFLGQVFSTLILSWPLVQSLALNKGHITVMRGRELIKRYRNFPQYSIAAGFANGLTAEIPVLMLSSFFGPLVVGHYSMASKLIGVPSSLISTSFGDVFQERASKDIHAFGNCRAIWMKTAKHLFAVAIPLFIITFIAAPLLFPVFLGEQWTFSGVYAQILSPCIFLGFIASPLSTILPLMEKQKQDLYWQIGLVILTTGAIAVSVHLGSPVLSIGFYSGIYSCMYLIYLWMSYKASDRHIVSEQGGKATLGSNAK